MARSGWALFGCVCAVVMLAVGASTASATFTKTTTKCLGEGMANVCLAEASEGELFEATGSETFTMKSNCPRKSRLTVSSGNGSSSRVKLART